MDSLTTAARVRAKSRRWERPLAALRSSEAPHQLWGYLFLMPMFLLLVVFKFITL